MAVEEKSVQEASVQAHDDSAVIFGRKTNLPIYTVVYIALAVLTVVEVALAEIVPRGGLTIPLMLIISAFKAGLVVWFYMHLNTDRPVYRIILGLPLAMMVLATIFLLIVPKGY
jgi:caa(3)-type oxidase subunit IV